MLEYLSCCGGCIDVATLTNPDELLDPQDVNIMEYIHTLEQGTNVPRSVADSFNFRPVYGYQIVPHAYHES